MHATRSTTRRTEIVRSEQFLEAYLWQSSSVLDKALEVNASRRVRETNPLYQPIFDYLAGQCFREIDWETVEDEWWIGGKYTRTVYTISAACPGRIFGHNCLYERKGMVRTGNGWLNIGQ